MTRILAVLLVRFQAAVEVGAGQPGGGQGPAASSSPRPPADVLGGEWSVWLVGAAAVVAVAVAGAAAVAYRRWVEGRSTRPSDVGPALPREEALRELERIRALEWHRNGRMADFYAATTDVLRGFAARIEPGWSTALTSRELLARMEGRWGRDSLSGLAPAVETAERVKFGGERPPPESAEHDWQRVRDWVREAPPGGR